MVQKELPIVIAVVIVIAMPVAPSNPSIRFDDKKYPGDTLRPMFPNALESCPGLSDENVQSQVDSCIDTALTPFQPQINEFRREGNGDDVNLKLLEIACYNRQSFTPCLYPYNALLKDCWSLGKENVETLTNTIADFVCDSNSRQKILELSHSQILRECIDSFENKTISCGEETAKRMEIEITVIPNHRYFCSTLNILNDCLPERSSAGCDESFLRDLVSHILKAILKAGGCPTTPTPGYFSGETVSSTSKSPHVRVGTVSSTSKSPHVRAGTVSSTSKSPHVRAGTVSITSNFLLLAGISLAGLFIQKRL